MHLIEFGSAEQEQQQIKALLDVPLDKPISFFWQYSDPSIILGRSQRLTDTLRQRAENNSVALINRAAGGGAVMAGEWMLSACTVIPTGHALSKMSLPESFQLVGKAWHQALVSVGVSCNLLTDEDVEQYKSRDKQNNVDWVCFTGLSHGEVVDQRFRKLVGLAQIRRKHGIAIVSGLLLKQPDWKTLTAVWLDHEQHNMASKIANLTASCDQLISGELPATTNIISNYKSQLNNLLGQNTFDW